MRSSLFVLAALMAATPVLASENLASVGAEKGAKAELVAKMQSRIARHEGMTREAILADIATNAAANREVLVKAGLEQSSLIGFDANVAKATEAMNALDKDGILALETARTQDVMNSANYIFAFIRWNMQFLSAAQNGAGTYSVVGRQGYLALTILCTPFAVIADVVLLPIELLVSAVTGF